MNNPPNDPNPDLAKVENHPENHMTNQPVNETKPEDNKATNASNESISTPTSRQSSSTLNPSAWEIAESLFGHIDWQEDTEGFCTCPGIGLHTTPDGERDCKIYLHPKPALTCFHASCKKLVEAASQKLRQTIEAGTKGQPRSGRSPAEILRSKEIVRKRNIRLRAASARDCILRDRWVYDDIIRSSPVSVVEKPEAHWRLLLACYHPDDVVWIGNMYDSGKPEHQNNFRTTTDWLKEAQAPGQFICPAVFKSNAHARTNNNIVTRRFLVVESDTLNRDEVGAVFRWLDRDVKLRLRAIVDTAGKSLHAWFVYPPDETVDELKLMLPELGCDPKLFTPSQPVRLPGAVRDGKRQKLVYLNPEVVV